MIDHQVHYPGPATIRRTVLDNGITVLTYENFAVESFVLQGVVRAGALGHGRDKAGLADFTAEMLLRGTHRLSFEEIYEELESAGASLSFDSGYHTVGFSGDGLVEDLDLVLSLAAEALRYPTFPEEHLHKVRGEILTNLQIRANDTARMAGLTFREHLYGDHPYGCSVLGYPDTIQSLTRDDMAALHATYYGPQGMIVTLVGAISHAEALARIAAVFGDWRNPQQQALPAAPPAARPAETVRVAVAMSDKTQSDIVLGLPGPLRSTPDFQAARLANVILGVFGMMGRLGESVREKQGLAYYCRSTLSSSLGPAPWSVATGVAPNKVEQAISSIQAEIRRMQQELVPTEELADSQAYLTGSVPVSLEANEGLASIIGDIELYGLGLDYLHHYAATINAITPAQIQAAAQKYFSADEVVIAVAGP